MFSCVLVRVSLVVSFLLLGVASFSMNPGDEKAMEGVTVVAALPLLVRSAVIAPVSDALSEGTSLGKRGGPLLRGSPKRAHIEDEPFSGAAGKCSEAIEYLPVDATFMDIVTSTQSLVYVASFLTDKERCLLLYTLHKKVYAQRVSIEIKLLQSYLTHGRLSAGTQPPKTVFLQNSRAHDFLNTLGKKEVLESIAKNFRNHPEQMRIVDRRNPFVSLIKAALKQNVEKDLMPAPVIGGGGGGGEGAGFMVDEATKTLPSKKVFSSVSLDLNDIYREARADLKTLGVGDFILKVALSDMIPSYKVYENKETLDKIDFKIYLWNELEKTLKITTKLPSYGALDEALKEESSEGKRRIQNIVIRDDLLAANKDPLNAYFGHNRDHKLVVDVGHGLAAGDPLVLTREQLPETLQHLIITNVKRNVTVIGHDFLAYCKELRVLDLSDLSKLKTIGNEFLYSCGGLKELDLSGLSELKTIGNSFLYSCEGLKELDLSGLSELKTIGDSFLAYCKELRVLDLSGLSKVTTIGNEFLYSCKGLKELDLSGLSELKTIGNEFLPFCKELRVLDLSGLSELKTIGNKFLYYCKELRVLDLSDLSNLKTIGNEFLYDCKELRVLDLSGLSKLKTIGNKFLTYCEGLKELDLSGLSKLKTIGDSFLAYCKELRVLDLSGLSNVKTIGYFFLCSCEGLKELDLSGLSKVTTIKYCFLSGCKDLSSLHEAIEKAGGPVTYIRSLK